MIDPFARAQEIQAQRQPAVAAAPAANSGSPMMSSISTSAQTDFSTMAQRMGLDVSNLHSNPEVAKLQLMNHLQGQLGPQFMDHPASQQLLSAFNASQPSRDPSEQQRDHSVMSAQAQRTMNALMQVNK